jgi:hypothetical protein
MLALALTPVKSGIAGAARNRGSVGTFALHQTKSRS